MRRRAAALLLVASAASAEDPEPSSSFTAPEASPAPAAAGASQSLMLSKEPPGLEFEVKLPTRSLRERDPRLQQLMDMLPDFGDPPRDWTDAVSDAIDKAARPREPGVLEEVRQRRIGQMSSGGGDDDAWTWTPPAR